MRIHWLFPLVIASLPAALQAQIQVIGPGSTVEGDVRRGEGVFLQGLGWYELNDAKAFDQYSKTLRDNDAYIRKQNDEARRVYNARVDADTRKQKLNEAAKRQYLAERESRLRTSPTQEDIERGDALNALLVDLSDPTIAPSAWRGSKLDLPEDISIKSLAFQFTPRPGAKASVTLSQGLIALGRLDATGRWPDYLPPDKLKAEMAAYEKAYATVRDQSKAKRLDLVTVLTMDRSLDALKSRIKVVVPPDRGFQAEAVRFVDDLIAATKMFNAATMGYAREMIADTSQHEAHTVGELLAFMRKYRLIFARADTTPGGSEMYARLYGLLKQQSEALGIKPEQVLTRAIVPAEAKNAASVRPSQTSLVQPDTVWRGPKDYQDATYANIQSVAVLKILTRDRDEITGSINTEETNGSKNNLTFSWHLNGNKFEGKEKGPGSYDMQIRGQINDTQIRYEFSGTGSSGKNRFGVVILNKQ